MDVPESLEAWTYDTIVDVVTEHQFEPGRFDYKEVLNPGSGGGGHVASIRKTACSMANGDGGYILFGVKDRAVSVTTPMDRVVGIPRASDLRKEFGEKVASIQRDLYFDAKAVDLPSDASKCVLVVSIPTSSLRPHMDGPDGRFWVRGEGGSARPMSFFEVRDQMLYTAGRLQKVTLLRLELATFQQIIRMLDEPATWSARFDASAFNVLLADICDLLQPDPSLVGLLHSIGRDAMLLNPLLDREESLRNNPSSTPEIVGGINVKSQLAMGNVTRRVELTNRCYQAESRLATLFGPLGTS